MSKKLMVVEDKTTKSWGVKNFMAQVAALAAGVGSPGVARRDIRVSFPGLPLSLSATPQERSPEVKAAKKAKRQARQRLIRRRGWA